MDLYKSSQSKLIDTQWVIRSVLFDYLKDTEYIIERLNELHISIDFLIIGGLQDTAIKLTHKGGSRC